MKKTLTILAALEPSPPEAATVFNYYTLSRQLQQHHSWFYLADSSALAPVSGSGFRLVRRYPAGQFYLRGPAAIRAQRHLRSANASDNSVIGLSTNMGTSGNAI
ncbi:MAG: hypothetical protein ACLT8E_08225 [Akkermansia sp.]